MTPSLVKEIFRKKRRKKETTEKKQLKRKEMAPPLPSLKPKTQDPKLSSLLKLCMLASFSLVHSNFAAGSDLHSISHGDGIFLLASHALRYVCGGSFLGSTFGFNQGCMCHSAIALCFIVGSRDGYIQGLSLAFCCNKNGGVLI